MGLGQGGPPRARNAIITGSWWLLREVELSTLRAAHVDIEGNWFGSQARVALSLPASKNDTAALGVARSHRCRCVGTVHQNCPVHAVVDQLLWLSRAFPGRFVDGVPNLDLPLFPDAAGGVVSKKAMAETIVAAANRLGVRDSPDGTLRITGHSLRSTGAQGLISIGWRPDAVQLQGRWLSGTVRRYTLSLIHI